ncbi:MAG: hypothetical protein ACRD0U_01265 [Acidimicrobiales bacterium]
MTDFKINPDDELPDDASIFVPDNDPNMPGYDPDRDPTYIDPNDPYGGGTPFPPDSDIDGTPDFMDTDSPEDLPLGLPDPSVWDTESGDKPWLTDPDWTPEGGDEGGIGDAIGDLFGGTGENADDGGFFESVGEAVEDLGGGEWESSE